MRSEAHTWHLRCLRSISHEIERRVVLENGLGGLVAHLMKKSVTLREREGVTD